VTLAKEAGTTKGGLVEVDLSEQKVAKKVGDPKRLGQGSSETFRRSRGQNLNVQRRFHERG
jgi:hypothetical protein